MKKYLSILFSCFLYPISGFAQTDNGIIERPFWLTLWALLLYLLVLAGIVIVAIRIILMKKQKKAFEEEIGFFINTTHDIRTPLTLIKAPLEALSEQKDLDKNGQEYVNTALKNVDTLLHLTSNLINFGSSSTHHSHVLHIAEYELGAYMKEVICGFRPHAETKHINLAYESNFCYLKVWMDKDKMDAIVRNILSNALKYTPEGGNVYIYAAGTPNHWSIEVKDTSIDLSDQKKKPKTHYKGNFINRKIIGSSIGLLLVWKLVRLHKGKLSFHSKEDKDACIRLTFPKDETSYKKAIKRFDGKQDMVKPENQENLPTVANDSDKTDGNKPTPNHQKRQQKILIVEDNDDLRNFLSNTLSGEYNTQTCSNGQQALPIIKGYMPDLIISDIATPEIGGDKLCQIVKEDIETSHIPVLLLIALNSEQDIINSLKAGADEYMMKPFNLGVLRATIANILANRTLLRKKYSNFDRDDTLHEEKCINCTTELDWEFITAVNQHIKEHMDSSNLNVDMLCSLMHMSRTSFYTKLKALTKLAPADYIRITKLNFAVQLLDKQKYSVTEVSERTGFTDAKYFRESFKKQFNISPTQYMKQNEANKTRKQKE